MRYYVFVVLNGFIFYKVCCNFSFLVKVSKSLVFLSCSRTLLRKKIKFFFRFLKFRTGYLIFRLYIFSVLLDFNFFIL